MEAYKFAVEMADRVPARRAVANAFFLTVNMALVAVVSLRGTCASSALLTVTVCVAGIAVAGCWWFLLQSYRRLSEPKFAVINKLEDEYLPVKIFSDEWALLGGPDAPKGRIARVKASFNSSAPSSRSCRWSSLCCTPCSCSGDCSHDDVPRA